MVGLLSAGCVLAEPRETKFTVRVTDVETGLPITHAEVRSTFTQERDPWGTGKGQFNQIKLPVDQSGAVTLSGYQGKFEEGISARVFADGYHTEGKGFKFTRKSLVLNRWEPWDPVIEVKMRPKKNPVPMVEKSFTWKRIPEMDKPIGFDLEKGDWIAPYGKGEISDFSFTASGYFQDPSKGSKGGYVLSFSNEHDGIQTYRFSEEVRSSFKWPYEAPLNGYQSSMEKFIYWPPNGGPQETDYDDKNNYIFRVRSRELADGKIVGCYGIIEGELQVGPRGEVKFKYWFNPVPNERSLEYNGENLLKK